MNETTIKCINALTEVIKYLSEMDRNLSEYAPSASATVDTFIDGILNAPPIPPTRETAVLQFNAKVQNRQVWTAKEMKKMPYLKDLKYRITKDGIHQFRYRRDGFNESFNSKNYEVAKKKAYDFIYSIKRELKRQAENVHGKSLDYFVQLWFDVKKKHCDPGTWKNYESAYRIHVAPVFGNRAIKHILPADLQPYFDDLFQRHPRTSEDVRTVLNGAFNSAVANRECPSNPMIAVIIEKHVRVKGKALSDDQIKTFIKTMLDNGSKFAIAALIILFTGIRGAELQSLTIDWSSGTFTVKNAKLKKSQKVNKDNIYRTVPIISDLVTIKPQIEKYGADLLMASSTMMNNFALLWQENTLKDLRHTFTTRARECGIDNELVNLWTGHLPGKNMTANIYTHFSMEYQKKEALKVKIIDFN